MLAEAVKNTGWEIPRTPLRCGRCPARLDGSAVVHLARLLRGQRV